MICAIDKKNLKIPCTEALLVSDEEAFATLNANAAFGCAAFVISTSKYYINNGAGEWVEVNV